MWDTRFFNGEIRVEDRKARPGHIPIRRRDRGCDRYRRAHKEYFGKVSAQPHTIVKQICFPNGNVLFLSLFSLFKN